MHPLVSHINNKDSFTLVELLVVIGILAILTAAVLIIINPAEYLKSSRDATRMSDLSSINRALSVLETQGITSFGTANRVYISIADDASSTCGSLGLPTLPTNWLYQCVSTSNLQKTDGTGWIPVNFSSAPSLSFSNLPIDPVNSTTTREYYTYVTGGSWKLSAVLTSSKRSSSSSSDGGIDPASYEMGSNKTLAPFTHGLIGYWKFDESSGTTAYDSSGYANDGTMYSSTTPTLLTTSSGCKLSNCLYLDGIDDYVSFTFNSILAPSSYTIMVWVKSDTNTLYLPIIAYGSIYQSLYYRYSSRPITYLSGTNYRYFNITTGGITPYDNQLHFASFVVTGNSQNDISDSKFYYEGLERPIYSTVVSGVPSTKTVFRIGRSNNYYFKGNLDEIRMYNRVLSASEIEAIYNATK